MFAFYLYQMIKRKKNITIDDLAGMVQRGFISVDKRFDEVDKRFNEVDKRFKQADLKIDRLEQDMNNRFDRIEKLFLEDHRERIEKLEGQMKDLQISFQQLAGLRK